MEKLIEKLWIDEFVTVKNENGDIFKITKKYDEYGGENDWDYLMKTDPKENCNPVNITRYRANGCDIGQSWNDFEGMEELIYHIANQMDVTSVTYDDYRYYHYDLDEGDPEYFSKEDYVKFKNEILNSDDLVIYPYNLYIHSGTRIYLGSLESHYDHQWDCTRAGYIWVCKKQYEKLTGCDWSKENAENEIKIFVDWVNDILEGNYYGLEIEKLNEDGEFEDFESGWEIRESILDEIAMDVIGKFKEVDLEETEVEKLVTRKEKVKIYREVQ